LKLFSVTVSHFIFAKIAPAPGSNYFQTQIFLWRVGGMVQPDPPRDGGTKTQRVSTFGPCPKI